MAEAAAIGIAPHLLYEYTHRELYAAFKGAMLRDTRARKLSLWASWNTANFSRAKKLPELVPLLRKLDPNPVIMSARALRSTVMGMAAALGAKVVHRKKREK